VRTTSFQNTGNILGGTTPQGISNFQQQPPTKSLS
jgi:hypothetical protein